MIEKRYKDGAVKLFEFVLFLLIWVENISAHTGTEANEAYVLTFLYRVIAPLAGWPPVGFPRCRGFLQECLEAQCSKWDILHQFDGTTGWATLPG